MKSRNTRFLVLLTCLVVALAGLTLLVRSSTPQFVTPYWSPLILLFSIISIAVYFITMNVIKKNDHNKFTNSYMAITLGKLFVYLAAILIYIIIFPEDKKAFVITFLAYYLCFTIFETYILVKNKN